MFAWKEQSFFAVAVLSHKIPIWVLSLIKFAFYFIYFFFYCYHSAMEMKATSSSTSKPIASEIVVISIQDTELSVLKKEIELLKAKNNLQDEEIRELKAKQ